MDTYSEIESEIKNRVVKIISNGWIIQCECFKVSNKTKKLGKNIQSSPTSTALHIKLLIAHFKKSQCLYKLEKIFSII